MEDFWQIVNSSRTVKESQRRLREYRAAMNGGGGGRLPPPKRVSELIAELAPWDPREFERRLMELHKMAMPEEHSRGTPRRRSAKPQARSPGRRPQLGS